MNSELKQLYEQDQADRHTAAELPPADLTARDALCRQRVRELLEEGAAQVAEDFFHSAMVLQHGQKRDDFLDAHRLAKRAADLGHPHARWLAAAAYDRWMMRAGLPQKYGTQYLFNGVRRVLYRVDPSTTDEERAAWDVPPLAEALRRAEQHNQPPVSICAFVPLVVMTPQTSRCSST